MRRILRQMQRAVAGPRSRRDGTDTETAGCFGKGEVMPKTLIEPHKGDKRYVRRSKSGQFTEKQVDVGRSVSANRRSKSKSVAKKGEGDRGDRPAR
jgi:hypothetical protein